MTVVADVDSDGSVLGFENGVAQIARCEIEFFPESRMHVRDVMLAVFAEVTSIRIDDCGSIEIHSRHLLLVDRNDDRHAMFRRELLHQLGCRPFRNPFGKLVPADVLLGAEIWPVKQLLQAKYFYLL